MGPPAHPKPPKDLATKDLPIKSVEGSWFRIHRTVHLNPIYFGKTPTHRFNSTNQTYGVLYLAADPHGAFIETFGHHTGGLNVVSERELGERLVSCLKTHEPLQLIDLTGSGLRQIGADNDLCNGRDYDLAQAWSEQLWSHPQQADGILYRARHDPDRLCSAIFDRVGDDRFCLEYTMSCLDTIFRRKLGEILNTYEFAYIDVYSQSLNTLGSSH